MADIVIKAENLGKSYIIGHEKREQYTAMRDVLANKARQIASKTRQLFKGGQLIAGNEMEEFWALKDLNFEIKQGDRVGIIGRNGAGKSTLLKVLSRITEPTTGRVTISGRVASLLEVGTGFHPELSGRENIYLNGAILGMSRLEIKKKFDEIVDFSSVEKFLDTPVKRYSSGMYVRLAFAVAAHMEPEILIIDEVLAVGDAMFQKKCLGKMEDVSVNQGRTVLFVSHNMAAIKSLCKSGILLDTGKIISNGNIEKVVKEYINEPLICKNDNKYFHKAGTLELEINDVIVNGKKNPNLKIFEEVKLEIVYQVNVKLDIVEFFVLIYNDNLEPILGFFQKDNDMLTIEAKINGYICLKTKNILMPGRYSISIGIFDKNRQFIDWVEHCEYFIVEDLYFDNRYFAPRLGMQVGNGEWMFS